MESYNPIKIEEKWRKRWEKDKTFKVDIKGQSASRRKPYYNLMMFPYPSAEGLHIGNTYAFTGSDIHGRYMKMRGFDVFEPIGFDSFGIHSENFAIQKGEHPRDLTKKNTEYFRDSQLKRMGNIFDWEHEVVTSDPSYYKWTQWLFLQLYKAGLAYRGKAAVDWCPSCKTVLADEQVIGGRCERCGSEVIQKELEQWFLKITKYAEKLLNNLEKIDWSPAVKTIQRNWIGKSEGATIKFEIRNPKSETNPKSQTQNSKHFIEVFTTRADTLFGATYMVLAPEHKLVEKLKDKVENWDEVQKYIKESKKKTDLERTDFSREKSGIELKGIKAINPANKEEIPVWVADYVLVSYGTGAVMAVPAHDQRDFEFAKKYELPIKMVICPNYPEKNCPVLDEAYEGEGHLVDSGEFTGIPSEEARDKITEFVAGNKKVNYHLRDWLISRQRYWGPPIPIIYCDKCGTVPVPEEDLPVELPYVEEFRPTGTDKSPLATVEEFIKTKCPKCGGEARRETDVSDTFFDSSWYFLRYPSVGVENSELKIENCKLKIPWNQEVTRRWLPVDMYVGGKEHAVLHLMYARFITMALNDLGFIGFEEPFKKFRAHGLLIREGAKMSKSKGNVINPDEYFDSYGADVLRMYLMFLGPYSAGGDWQDKGIVGISRFLKRVWSLVNDHASQNNKSEKSEIRNPTQSYDGSPHRMIGAKSVLDSEGRAPRLGLERETNPNDQNSKNINELARISHKTIKKVTEDIEGLQYNTAISALMEFTNEISKQKSLEIGNWKLEILLKLLAPFAPHITEELWRETLGHRTSIHSESWPEYEEKYLVEDKVSIVIQINGKVRGQIEVEKGSDEKKVKELALREEKISKWLKDKKIKKVIYIQDRVINFVV